jgi:thymidylate kinase
MFSVALIGPDGAGKTTIARMLEERSSLPVKYIYMGVNIEASNYALPTSRFVEFLRRRQNGKSDKPLAEGQFCQHPKKRKTSVGALLWAAGRLANHLAEEWYRQLWSWGYRFCGSIVVYDRHYLFDFSFDDVDPEQQGFDSRLHRWFLAHVYPRPDLVIYLDAPAEVLFARKGEKDIEDLGRRRQSFARQMKQSPNCVVVDGTQPLSKVYADVTACIFRFYKTRRCDSVPLQEGRPAERQDQFAATLTNSDAQSAPATVSRNGSEHSAS